VQQFINTLLSHDIEFKEHESLAKYTTWKIGGPADVVVYPKTEEELQIVVSSLYETQTPWFVIGKGSNLLVQDSGYQGVIIKLSKDFDAFEVQGDTVIAKGGCSLVKLSLLVSKQGLSGLEFIGGVPGTVGGAVCMNAGAHGSDISAILTQARVMNEMGEIITYTNEELQFSYRHSLLSNQKGIVLDATFQMTQGNKEEITKKQADLKAYRFETQPLKEKSCGSVFANPLPHSSGNLIEQLGLKGHRIGGAMFSDKHANFIVNVDGASSSDVLSLIQTAQTQVKKSFDVELRTEVKILG